MGIDFTELQQEIIADLKNFQKTKKDIDMKKEDYERLKETIEKYDCIEKKIENLECEKCMIQEGIYNIYTENGKCIYISEHSHGELKELLKKKIVDAYDDQIEQLQKQLEEL